MEEGNAGGDLGAGQAMEEKGAGEAVLAEEAEVEIVVEEAFAGGFVTSVAVVIQIFGVGESDILAKQRESLFEDLFHAGEGAGGEEVGGVESDLEVRGGDLIEEAAGLGGGVDDVVDLGLEGKYAAGLSSDLGGFTDAGGHVAPGLGGGVVGVGAPHALVVAGAGADVNGGAREGTGENTEAGEARLALGRVGVAHVEGALEAREAEAAGFGFAKEAGGETRGDFFGQIGQAGAGQAELDAV